MMKRALLVVGAFALGVNAAAAQNTSVKIGFVSTFSGPTGAMGNDMRNSFELALDQLGRKMGGIPVEVIYEDDQQKPEVGNQKTEKLIEFGQGRFHRRLYLVERFAGLYKVRGRFQKHS